VDLPNDVALELDDARIAEEEGNHGKARTCARRAVGKAFLHSPISKGFPSSVSATQILDFLRYDSELPEEVKSAAGRLATSVADIAVRSVSVKPIEDAMIVIRIVLGE
jgi:hypothetical protein